MYPVYPLLAFMAAYALSTMIDMVCDLSAQLLGNSSSSVQSSSASSGPKSSSNPAAAAAAGSVVTRNKKLERLRSFLVGGCVSVTFILFSTRSISNYNNYKGEGESNT